MNAGLLLLGTVLLVWTLALAAVILRAPHVRPAPTGAVLAATAVSLSAILAGARGGGGEPRP